MYYIAYLFHNPVAIQHLLNIQHNLWIDWPGDLRMRLSINHGVAFLSIEFGAYECDQTYEREDILLHVDPHSKYFLNRIKVDTDALIHDIDAINKLAEERPELHLPTDPRDGIKLVFQPVEY
jgi:hypothetical protein